jgi:hypothetical protein
MPKVMGQQAQRLFASGVDSISKGSWAPFIIAVVGEFLSLEGSTGKSCTYVSNPDEVQHPEVTRLNSLKFGWKETLSGLEKGETQPFGIEYTQYDTAEYVPCREAGRLAYSCRYSFDQWNERIEKGFSEATGYEKSSNPGKKAIWDFWAGWKYLTPEERRNRYKYNAEVCLLHVAGEEISDDQRIALEVHLGGRFIGDKWSWEDQVFEGHALSSWPPWIPLDEEDQALRSVYARMHFDNGLHLEDLTKIAQMDMTIGLSSSVFEELDENEQRKAMANAHVIAAAKAGANSEKYLSQITRLKQIQEKDLGWSSSVGKKDIEEAIDRMSSTARATHLERMQGAKRKEEAAAKTKKTLEILIGAGAFVLGLGTIYMYIRLRKLKKKKKKKRRR